ncbi:AHH domain-containing protein [Chromobacterium sp. IIBBL 290-4]|uniref:AHH domain-containing protein n=1 Tax=Chromobacterium sp. IIBBL 290-4 TaxID=2953890 RepID=UPI0020B7DCB5|nr:AHH domain-containing protein [Chromobacterium sp. IIBBL 290-4]UTH76600.1 AHH domain-containing protein [Chromobacterium sp. IIBBL 290-4]
MTNKSARDSKYRKLILRHVALKKEHPIHSGIAMQAHHLISASGVKISMTGNWLEKMGYNINLLPNLALIPSTLQGACHLGVQPHKSGHTIASEMEETDDDDMHPKDYHALVARELRVLKAEIQSLCFGNDQDALNKLNEKMNHLSEKILHKIQTTPHLMRLSAVADYYLPGLAGCGGVDNIPKREKGEVVQYTEKHICTVHRNHYMAQGKGQAKENITYKKPLLAYKLQVGN